MYYERVFKIFRAKKVDYLIAGGMAVNLYGVPRFTKDLDILVNPSTKNLKRLQGALRTLAYRPKIPVSLAEFLNLKNWERWKKKKGMIAFNLFHPKRHYEEIDILIHSPIPYSAAKRRQTKVRAGGMVLHLIAIDDLIRMKRLAGRQQDLADIEALKKVKTLRRQL